MGMKIANSEDNSRQEKATYVTPYFYTEFKGDIWRLVI